MSAKFQKLDNGTPQNGRARDVSSADSGMMAGHADNQLNPPAVRENRRLRNWILLANAVVWISAIVLIRWLLF